MSRPAGSVPCFLSQASRSPQSLPYDCKVRADRFLSSPRY
jgi:hypothetical protein